jgi:hypothetical protein
MRKNKYSCFYIIVLLIITSGCVKQQYIKSPYQVALESYYTALKDSENPQALNDALTKVNLILTEHPADLESRVLRANIFLLQFRLKHPLGQEAVNKMMSDLQVISESLPSADSSADWVQSRVYVTMGDYLLLKANGLVKMAGENPTNKFIPPEAKAYFEAAAEYYAFAHSISASKKENASLGLKHEITNALGGYVQATQGIVLSLDMLNPQGNLESVQDKKAQTLDLLKKLYESSTISSPGANMVSFNPSAHNNIRRVYGLLATQLNQALRDECVKNVTLLNKPSLNAEEQKIVKEMKELLDRRRLYVDYAAAHAALHKVLDPQTEGIEGEVQKVENAYAKDLKSFCENILKQ